MGWRGCVPSGGSETVRSLPFTSFWRHLSSLAHSPTALQPRLLPPTPPLTRTPAYPGLPHLSIIPLVTPAESLLPKGRTHTRHGHPGGVTIPATV